MNWKKIGSITALRVARTGLVLGLVPPSTLNLRLTNAVGRACALEDTDLAAQGIVDVERGEAESLLKQIRGQ
jgi:hypothetical protein